LITDPIFWKDSTDLVSATNYLYINLPDFNSATDELYSDFALDIRTTTVNSISDGSRVVPSTDTVRWDRPYRNIRAANNILEKSAAIADGPTKTFCVAQARFFRALSYFNLV